MDIERFKHQHVEILDGIAKLRRLAHAGIKENAHEIAQAIASLSNIVKLHLAIEDRILYPALQSGSNARLAAMGKAYQEDMQGIASGYIAFSRHWSTATAIAEKAEQFRAEANTVLKTVYSRMQKENTEFYPAIEAL
ncbi:hemerythrin domain-containing protein [Alcaligenaceae bacterium]|nr:hemerythrin domain-containing protein [Alcaligenaceae bacterium]